MTKIIEKSTELPWSLDFAKRWQNIPIPARPCPSELKFIESYVSQTATRKNPKILVLGSTPEFRDIILKNNCKPIVVDINLDVYEALKNLMKEKGEEEFINADWLELPTHTKYDLILGDWSVNMLPWNKFDSFFRKIKLLLKSNGFHVQRIPGRYGIRRKEDFLKSLQIYRKFYSNKHIFGQLMFDCLFYAYDTENEYVHIRGMVEKLEKLFKEGLLLEREFKAIAYFVNELQICIPHKWELEQKIMKHFDMLDVFYGSESESQRLTPVYVLVKKGVQNG